MPLLAVVLALAAPVRGATGPEPSAPVGTDVREQSQVRANDPGEEVVVTAARAEGADAQATSASVTVIAVDQRLAATADVAQVMQGVAGASVVHLGGLGDFSAVSIRGSSLRQVEVLLDGVPLNPDGSDVVNLSELPLQAFSRVEVWRSGAPPWFGAAPIGGVVDLVTADEPTGAVAISYGQYDTARAFAMQAFRGKPERRHVDGMVVADLFGTRGDFAYFDDNATVYTVTDDWLRTRSNDAKRQLSTLARLRWGDSALGLSMLDTFLSETRACPAAPTRRPPGPDCRPCATWPWPRSRDTTMPGAAPGDFGFSSGRRPWSIRLTRWDWRRHPARPVHNSGHPRRPALGPAGWLMPAMSLDLRRDQYVQADLDSGRVDPPRFRYSATAALSADLRLLHDQLTLSPVLPG